MATVGGDVKSSGVNSGIRIAIALLVSIILALFILFWEMNHGIPGVPHWIGPMVILPLLAVVLSFGSNCLIQQLSCSQIQWLVQLQRVAVVPAPFYATWLLLYLIPAMRWPIEGLAQSVSPSIRTGFSSAFYTFWIGMYSQGLLNSLAQLCPK